MREQFVVRDQRLAAVARLERGFCLLVDPLSEGLVVFLVVHDLGESKRSYVSCKSFDFPVNFD